MSKAGKRVKSGTGQQGGAKWEQALLTAAFDEVMFVVIFEVFWDVILSTNVEFVVLYKYDINRHNATLGVLIRFIPV